MNAPAVDIATAERDAAGLTAGVCALLGHGTWDDNAYALILGAFVSRDASAARDRRAAEAAARSGSSEVPT